MLKGNEDIFDINISFINDKNKVKRECRDFGYNVGKKKFEKLFLFLKNVIFQTYKWEELVVKK